MEANSSPELPPEIWSHILTFIKLADIFRLRTVNKTFNNELETRNPLEDIKDVKWNEDLILKYRSRTLPHLTEAQIVDYWRNGEATFPLVNRDSERSYIAKIILLGSPHVGKTTLFASFSEGHYTENNPMGAIGIDFVVKTFKDLGVSSKIQLFDTAGTERFRDYHSPSYYRGASGALLCFRIDDRKTFIDLIHKYFGPPLEKAVPNVICYLVGTKSDLEANRAVSKEEAEAVARVFKMKYFEVSSKEFKNVNEVFHSIRIDILHAMTLADDDKPMKHSKNDRRCTTM